MAIITRAEFCELTGISNAHITMYAKRGKLLLSSDRKHLDTENELNKEFISAQVKKGLDAIKASKTRPPKKEKQSSSKKLNKGPEDEISDSGNSPKPIGNKWELELEKLRADIDKKYIDSEVAKEKLNVLRGNNIPIDEVKTIISMLAHSMITNYKSFQEQHISDICHEFRISETDRAKILKKNTSGLNAIHRKAVSDSKKQLRVSIGNSRSSEVDNEEN